MPYIGSMLGYCFYMQVRLINLSLAKTSAPIIAMVTVLRVVCGLKLFFILSKSCCNLRRADAFDDLCCQTRPIFFLYIHTASSFFFVDNWHLNNFFEQ